MNAAVTKSLNEYRVITITHKTTSIQRLKDYLVDAGDAGYPHERLREIRESFGMKELLYLNTCNRVTFLFTGTRTVDHDFLAGLFNFINPNLKDELVETHINVSAVYEGRAALEHFFSVAASLDSLIVGEREILGQIKEAYAQCREYGLCGDSIRLAVEHAIIFAKRIYHETRIGEKPVSVVSLAFRQLQEHLPHRDSGIVMIGAGQTNQQLANFLHKNGYTNVHVFNRTLEKAQELADKVGGKAYELKDLAAFREPFQVVASCTGSHEYVLTLDIFRRMNTDPAHTYTILDLAVPRDVDPAIERDYQVHYINVASLEEQAHINLAFRRQEVHKAQDMLADFIAKYEATYRQRQLELALKGIPEEVKALRSRALGEVFAKDIDRLDDDARRVLDDVVSYFEKKYIGIPMKIAKRTILGLDNFKD